MKHEYRVLWQRQGQAKPVRRLYQTEAGALGCVQMLVSLEDDKRDDITAELPDRHYLHDLPNLIGPPTIEVRSVGEWEDYQ